MKSRDMLRTLRVLIALLALPAILLLGLLLVAAGPQAEAQAGSYGVPAGMDQAAEDPSQVRYTLVILVAGEGSVTRNPDKPLYDPDDAVELTASPEPGWFFDHWSGALSGSENPKTLIMTDNKSVLATFSRVTHLLNVQVIGQGSVQRDPDKPSYDHGDEVELMALPAAGWRFVGWGGDLSGSTNPKILTMTSDVQATATFERIEYTIEVNVVGQGQVGLNPQQQTYHYGDHVVLTATPDTGWAFDHWSGDAGGSQNPKTVTIYDNMQVTAHFVRPGYQLSVQIVGKGSVEREPDQPVYYSGDKVKLTAKPDPGWRFVSWSGDLAGSDNPKILTITGNAQVTATFAKIEYTLVVEVVGQGQVIRNPQQASYHYGDIITLTANPAPGWSFARWSGDLSGSENPKTFSITGNVQVTAHFVQVEYRLEFQIVGQGQVERNPVRQTYHYGDQVVLTATADNGWQFQGWSGDASGSENPKTIAIMGNMRIVATFVPREYVINTTIVGRGKVLFQPNQPTFHLGDKVTLTAWAPIGWQFEQWGGDVSGLGMSVILVVKGDHQVTATFVQDPPGTRYHAYMTGILEAWPPYPREPAMRGISNPDGLGDYTVHWGTSLWAKTYTLQEARDAVFTDAMQLYQGPLTYYQASGRGAGRYFYRTKAHNGWGDSPWSSTSWVDVRWEREPNGEPLSQSNGPIVSGLTYYGSFGAADDLVDYFVFDLSSRRRVQLSLTEIPNGHNYDLILQDAGLRLVARSELAVSADEHVQTDRLEPGRYYVSVVNASRSASADSYRLRVAYD